MTTSVCYQQNKTQRSNSYSVPHVVDVSLISKPENNGTRGDPIPIGFCTVKEICSICVLQCLEYDGYTSLTTLPESVKKEGRNTMRSLYESLCDPIYEFLHGRGVPPERVQELSSARISEFGSILDDSTADVTFVVNNESITAH